MSQSGPSRANITRPRDTQATSEEEVNPETKQEENLQQSKENKDTPEGTRPSHDADKELSEETRNRRLKLYRAALNGDWKMANDIFQVCEEDIRVGISKRGDTALHIAATAKRIDFVKELVHIMTEKDLARTNKVGSTALVLAAASGEVELARVMMNRNKAIAMVPDKSDMLPIQMAASLGHKEMVEYLYKETKDFLNEKECTELLITLINTDLYDIALNLLTDYPALATGRARNQETALHALARKPPNRKPEMFKRWFSRGAKDVENKKLQALKLAERLWKEVIRLSDSKISDLIASPRRLIFDAAKQGNVEFLSILIREYPDLIWKIDGKLNKYSIFHIAVLNRQEDIFKLIYEIGSAKDLIAMTEDREKNNILHLAGKLAPTDRLNTVSGPALQMQHELLWFQEVRDIVQPRLVEAENKEGITPRALFTEKHKELREKGEEWMKSTAESCMVVAALIATVVFAAAITVPGGNNGDTGLPFFLHKVPFKIFVISDVISLVSSAISIVTFLSILTSRYAEEDFLWRLPRKFLVGLAALLISIATLMVVFSTTIFILFINRTTWVAILVTLIASLPVFIFCYQQWRLFYDVLRSTYVKDSLFEKGKIHLFLKEGEASEYQKANQFNVHLKIQCTCSTNV